MDLIDHPLMGYFVWVMMVGAGFLAGHGLGSQSDD